MERVDLWLDDDDIKSAHASTGFDFAIPADAVRRGDVEDPADLKGRADWAQVMTVQECKFYADQTKAPAGGGETYPCVTAEISFQIASDALRPNGEPDPNAGKQKRVWWRIVPAAMKNKQHPKYKANNFAIGRLSGLLRSIWGSTIFPPGQRVNYGEYFGGDNPPVVGQSVSCNIQASKWNGTRQDDITEFVPREMRK